MIRGEREGLGTEREATKPGLLGAEGPQRARFRGVNASMRARHRILGRILTPTVDCRDRRAKQPQGQRLSTTSLYRATTTLLVICEAAVATSWRSHTGGIEAECVVRWCKGKRVREIWCARLVLALLHWGSSKSGVSIPRRGPREYRESA